MATKSFNKTSSGMIDYQLNGNIILLTPQPKLLTYIQATLLPKLIDSNIDVKSMVLNRPDYLQEHSIPLLIPIKNTHLILNIFKEENIEYILEMLSKAWPCDTDKLINEMKKQSKNLMELFTIASYPIAIYDMPEQFRGNIETLSVSIMKPKEFFKTLIENPRIPKNDISWNGIAVIHKKTKITSQNSEEEINKLLTMPSLSIATKEPLIYSLLKFFAKEPKSIKIELTDTNLQNLFQSYVYPTFFIYPPFPFLIAA